MPPVRTIPPAKPVKTERTHAENQERAYIAASRRSDRSLEARVESARRASEIHKKRTGRSLRVTEADVINEEMYEEEDDDLPAQIRRITAHLHTGNDPFNRRLQSYLANHIAMRSALGQVVADNWQQQQMQNNTLNQYLTPNMMQPQQQQQQQPQSQPQQQTQSQPQQPQQSPYAFQHQMLPPQSATMPSPRSYRTTPYPVATSMPNSAAHRAIAHRRAASVATIHQDPANHPVMLSPTSMSAHSSPVDTKTIDRRFSMPPQAMPPTPQTEHHNSQSSSPAISRTTSSISLASGQTYGHGNRPGPLNLSHPMFTSPFGVAPEMNFGPLTASLPLESQQLLAGAPPNEFNDPSMAAMMQTHLVPTPGGSFSAAPAFYSYNPNGSKNKSKSAAPAAPSTNFGMNATLAPSMLDVTAPHTFPETSNDPMLSAFATAGYNYGFDANAGDMFQPDLASGQITPGETDWHLWLDSQALSEEPTAI